VIKPGDVTEYVSQTLGIPREMLGEPDPPPAPFAPGDVVTWTEEALKNTTLKQSPERFTVERVDEGRAHFTDGGWDYAERFRLVEPTLCVACQANPTRQCNCAGQQDACKVEEPPVDWREVAHAGGWDVAGGHVVRHDGHGTVGIPIAAWRASRGL